MNTEITKKDTNIAPKKYVLKKTDTVKKYSVDYGLIVYPNAGHGYDAPFSKNYDAEATQDTFNKIRLFFSKYLKY